jgi:NADH-quinone oxidoreductase subunit I
MRSLIAVVGGLWSFVSGMWVTLINALRRPVTFQYPEKYYVPLEGFRGHPALVVEPATGQLKCTACLICVKACPLGIIHIEVGQRDDKKRFPTAWDLDFGRCMVCNLCVEACPFGALVMSPAYELSEYQPEDLVYDMERLKLPAGGVEVSHLDGSVSRVDFAGGDRS